ncbi:hypothetical protein PENSPDRAFT_572729 [Peniophora sp. CONT]|nr:hypothetical protein PENSPDRAFT_572729 [Peniophora sp. CONT]
MEEDEEDAPPPPRTPSPPPRTPSPTPEPRRAPSPPANPTPPPPPPPPPKKQTVPFGGQAGQPIQGGEPSGDPFSKYEGALSDAEDADNAYHPFKSKLNWDLAAWAKTHGIGSNALTDMLKIEGVVDRLELQYSNTRELNQLMDKELPPRPDFTRHTYELGKEKLEGYMRDSLEVLKELYGRPEFANSLIYAPEKQYKIVERNGVRVARRLYSDMHTGKWWWGIQEKLEADKPGATVVPLIISSDKTQLTLFRNRSCYPVYLTIGNIPKELRRKVSLHGQVLLGYIPVTKLEGIKNVDVRRRALAQLYHTCMTDMLAPLKAVAKSGVVLTSGDGARRRCHPLLAAFVGDYPEQILVAGVKYGLCPKGTLDPSQFGNAAARCELRDTEEVVEALETLEGDPQNVEGYVEACQEAGVKPIDPFWRDYPYQDIYQSFPPDILHQIYQGLVKHMLTWLKVAYGEKALDARFKCLPANHQLRQFSKGISNLSRVSGKEHQDICRVLLGVIIDAPVKKKKHPARLLQAVRALLDFTYLVQFPEASEDTLDELQRALKSFHKNKWIFKELKARKHFDFPKMHALYHYAESIRLFGTADNFNTAYSERLHIDFAKSAWRATNRKDEYPQMTVWLQRREQIRAHQAYIDWRLSGRPAVKDMAPAPLPRAPKFKRKVARTPSVKCLSFEKAERYYGAGDFDFVLKEYALKILHPTWSDRRIRRHAKTYQLPFQSVSAYHRMKFWHADALEREGDAVQELPDSIRARPAFRDTQRRKMEGQFNTALVDEFGDGGTYFFIAFHLRIGQVRLIFSISETAKETTFADKAGDVPDRLAYIEWFSRKPAHPASKHHGLYCVERSAIEQDRLVSILPIDRIKRSVSLFPCFGKELNPTWTKDNVLEKCTKFFINPFSDRHAYITMDGHGHFPAAT